MVNKSIQFFALIRIETLPIVKLTFLTHFPIRLVQYSFTGHLVVRPVSDIPPALLLVPSSLAVSHTPGPQPVILLAPVPVVLDPVVLVLTLGEIAFVLGFPVGVEFGALALEETVFPLTFVLTF